MSDLTTRAMMTTYFEADTIALTSRIEKVASPDA